MMKGQYWELAARLQSRLGLRSQEWLGDLCGASQGRISLYLQGARPRLSVLVLMARALDDDPRELARLAGYDPRWALDLYTLHFVLGSEYLDALEEAQAKYIRVREVDGDAQGALEALLGLEAGLRAKMAKRAPGLPRARFVERKRAELMSDILACYRVFEPGSLQPDLARDWLRQMDAISRRHSDDAVFAARLGCRAHAYYLAGGDRYRREAERDFKALLDSDLEDALPDDNVRLTAYQAMAGLVARHGDQRLVASYDEQIGTLLAKSKSLTIEVRALAYIGRAISRASLGSSDWSSALEEAFVEIRTAEQAGGTTPLLRVQAAFAEVYARRAAGETHEGRLYDAGQAGIELAQIHGYRGFEEMITRMVMHPK